VQLTEIDLTNPDSFVEAYPHEAFKRLRREAPIYKHPDEDGYFYALTRYEDVVAVSQDAQTFSSARGTNIPVMRDEQGLALLQMLMLNMDPPRHTKYRRLVSAGFTPAMIRKLEPHVREMTDRIIDNVAARGECDFVTEIAAELPLQAIAELIGVPLEDRHKIFEWSNRLIGFDDPEYGNSTEGGREAATQMFMYANELATTRRAQPQQDLVSVLMDAEVDGERLSEPEFDAFFLLLAVAGNETTRNAISGGMLALFEHPEQRARLAADPSLMPSAIEEILRWVAPVMYFRRTALRDAELRGTPIREGDRVVLYYGSANRDEEVFPDGDVFDVGRSPNQHLSFGAGGPHFCLGASLARLEMRMMFEQVLARLPDIELAGPAPRLRSNFINGIKHMPVRFTPQRA
jgi:cholest-4-en-3-one 26-monooxygenase